ncbi:hypothetical protein N7539_008630 [Penicillium diatomitis]|uniref:MARVEL domain-containing protein n=1 Tax=Penicillium diatomitis TaxID=2819901 RepID=A0A9W9WRA0_9EURO|nr:uncharacterized protein N7539_008630 [Penicillium diatomitis]KAJ5472061.1 hypothetical protein N7539_008630 [Penicillium diatomitis]
MTSTFKLPSFSLSTCLTVFWGYWKGAHRQAEKITIYDTIFSIGFFAFHFIMWIIATSIDPNNKVTSNGEDIWDWFCTANTWKQLLSHTISCTRLCRLQKRDSFSIAIGIVINLVVLLVYGIGAYGV